MVYDVVLVCLDSDENELDRLTMKCEDMTYDIDRKITVYEIGIIKLLSDALEALGQPPVWTNWITDWGKSLEKFTLSCVISEDNKYNALVKMMEIGTFVREMTYTSARNLLYIGADPTDPTDLSKYAVMAGEGPRIGMDPTMGIECKVTRCTFKHTGNKKNIEYTMDIIVGMDFELT